MAPFAETPILSSYRISPIEVFKEPDLLDGWWSSDYLFLLERRAIFSKTWICITHRSRFIRPGDYISLELAGFPVLIILGKDHIARAFHNVCRHRAYTITKKPAGSSLVLGCRYHGWSYDTKGNLVKAPQFDGIEGFDKSENSLFKIRTCTDRAGFIYINLDGGQFDHAPDCDNLVSFSADYDISTTSTWLAGWNVEGGFNWKTAGANDRTGIGTPASTTRKVTLMDSILALFRRPRPDVGHCQVLHLSPLTAILAFPKSPIWVTLTTLPLSADKCVLKCDAFSSSVVSLDPRDLENLKSYTGSYIQDLQERYAALKGSNPTPTEELPTLPLLKAHLKLERLVGTEIYPGRREDGKSASFCRAEKVCKDLDAIAKAEKATCLARVASAQSLQW